RGMKFFAATIVGLVLLAAPAAAQQPSFNQFIQSLWPEAQKIGVSRKTFDAETRGLTPDLSLPDLEIPSRVERPPAQAEFVQTPEQDFSEALTARFALQGKQYANKYRDTLLEIEKRFGTPGSVILAIWARETSFGGAKLPHD